MTKAKAIETGKKKQIIVKERHNIEIQFQLLRITIKTFFLRYA